MSKQHKKEIRKEETQMANKHFKTFKQIIMRKATTLLWGLLDCQRFKNIMHV